MKEIVVQAQGFLRGITPLGVGEILQKLEETGTKFYPIADVYRGILYIVLSDTEDTNIILKKLAEIDKPKINAYLSPRSL